MKIIAKRIPLYGSESIIACDGRCEKAFGLNSRPTKQLSDDPDDFCYLADDEVGTAPADPGTYEGGEGKPDAQHKLQSKWCARECERCGTFGPTELIDLPDLSQRFYNIRPHRRPTIVWLP